MKVYVNRLKERIEHVERNIERNKARLEHGMKTGDWSYENREVIEYDLVREKKRLDQGKQNLIAIEAIWEEANECYTDLDRLEDLHQRAISLGDI
jgi:hypothetical protein